MAKYVIKMQKATTSATVGVGAIETTAATPRRFKLYDWSFGSETTPADNAFLVRINRVTTGVTGTTNTPNPTDPADAASQTTSRDNLTIEGTVGVEMADVPVNQRGTYRWVAYPGSELVVPAANSNGLMFRTPTAQNTPAGSFTAFFEEQ